MGLKFGPSLLGTCVTGTGATGTGVTYTRVPTRILQTYPGFAPLVENASFVRCFTDANLLCKDVDIFKNPINSTKLASSQISQYFTLADPLRQHLIYILVSIILFVF